MEKKTKTTKNAPKKTTKKTTKVETKKPEVITKKTVKEAKRKSLTLDLDFTYQITLLLQLSLAIFIISFGVASCFMYELFVICEALVAIMMFVLAYNNQKVYKRKYMTWIYLAIGIIMLSRLLFV